MAVVEDVRFLAERDIVGCTRACVSHRRCPCVCLASTSVVERAAFLLVDRPAMMGWVGAKIHEIAQ